MKDTERELVITVPVGTGNTLYTDCGGCPLVYGCPNGYMGDSFCNNFDFSRMTVSAGRKGGKGKKGAGAVCHEDEKERIRTKIRELAEPDEQLNLF